MGRNKRSRRERIHKIILVKAWFEILKRGRDDQEQNLFIPIKVKDTNIYASPADIREIAVRTRVQNWTSILANKWYQSTLGSTFFENYYWSCDRAYSRGQTAKYPRFRQETILHIKSLKTRYFTEVSNGRHRGQYAACRVTIIHAVPIPLQVFFWGFECIFLLSVPEEQWSVLWINMKSFVPIFVCARGQRSPSQFEA